MGELDLYCSPEFDTVTTLFSCKHNATPYPTPIQHGLFRWGPTESSCRAVLAERMRDETGKLDRLREDRVPASCED